MSLYRKYRPQTFEDVVGQEHVARTLRNALTASPPKVAHAYLFTGPRGIGKTTNARLLAKCLNCEQGPTPTPCNQCDFCVRVSTNQPTMDLMEIDAASNTGVDNVRENIIDKINVAPAQGRYRVYIIDEVHMLSASSFNALLKTLEEPPAHAIFILATTDSHKVPQTILSRCQRFDFRRVGPSDIVKRLQYVADCEEMTLQDEAARLIARHADGALRDALTLLEQVWAFSGEEITSGDVRLVLGGVPQELLHGLMDAVANQDARATLELIDKAVEEGASFSQLARDLVSYCRDLLLLLIGFPGQEGLSPQENALRDTHSRALGRAKLESLLESLRAAEKEMRNSTDHRLLLELTLLRATESAFGAVATSAIPVASASPAASPSGPQRPSATQFAPKSALATVAVAPVVAPSAPSEVRVAPSEVPVPSSEVLAAPSEVETAPDGVQVPSSEVELAPSEGGTPNSEHREPPKAKKQGRRISTFEDLVELWPHVLMRIKKKVGVTAVAYLHDAQPVGLTDDEVILQFGKEFHHAKACEASGRLPFEAVICEILDKPRRLKLQLAPKALPKTPEPVAEPSGDDDDDDDPDILSWTQELFGAEVMGRSGR